MTVRAPPGSKSTSRAWPFVLSLLFAISVCSANTRLHTSWTEYQPVTVICVREHLSTGAVCLSSGGATAANSAEQAFRAELIKISKHHTCSWPAFTADVGPRSTGSSVLSQDMTAVQTDTRPVLEKRMIANWSAGSLDTAARSSWLVYA